MLYEKIYRGFLSSTSGNGILDDFRRIIKDEMIKRDTLPVMMEHNFHGTGDEMPFANTNKALESCDYYVFIIEAFGGDIIGSKIAQVHPRGCPLGASNEYLSVCKNCNEQTCNLTYVQFEYFFAVKNNKLFTVLLHESADKPVKYISQVKNRKGSSADENYLESQNANIDKTNQLEFIKQINKNGWIYTYNENNFNAISKDALNALEKKLTKDENLGAMRRNVWQRHNMQQNDTFIMEHLGLNKKTGEVTNMESNQRQVVFRVATFNLLLDSIFKYIMNEKLVMGDSEVKNNFYENLMYSSGRTCGEDFAERTYENFTLNANKNIDKLNELIKIWCEFDTNVGFGKLELTEAFTLENSILIGKMNISNCFISEYVGDDHPDRCWFIRGYCEGVVKVFARKLRLNGKCKVKFDCLNNHTKNCNQRIGGDICEHNIEGRTDLSYSSYKWEIKEINSEEA
jgi:hypothetical protein